MSIVLLNYVPGSEWLEGRSAFGQAAPDQSELSNPSIGLEHPLRRLGRGECVLQHACWAFAGSSPSKLSTQQQFEYRRWEWTAVVVWCVILSLYFGFRVHALSMREVNVGRSMWPMQLSRTCFCEVDCSTAWIINSMQPAALCSGVYLHTNASRSWCRRPLLASFATMNH
jgi:hypothetical protein